MPRQRPCAVSAGDASNSLPGSEAQADADADAGARPQLPASMPMHCSTTITSQGCASSMAVVPKWRDGLTVWGARSAGTRRSVTAGPAMRRVVGRCSSPLAAPSALRAWAGSRVGAIAPQVLTTRPVSMRRPPILTVWFLARQAGTALRHGLRSRPPFGVALSAKFEEQAFKIVAHAQALGPRDTSGANHNELRPACTTRPAAARPA